MPLRRFTPGGSFPPSCRYLCTASRPVNNVPEISTASPTFSERISPSSHGVVSFAISIEPSLNLTGAQLHALAPIRPAHVTDADKVGHQQPIRSADFHAEQNRLAAETHRPDAEFVRRV